MGWEILLTVDISNASMAVSWSCVKAPSRLRCRRCALEYEVVPRLPVGHSHEVTEPCPRCEPPADIDALESFLSRLRLDEES